MNNDFLIRHATLRQLQLLVTVAYSQSYTRAAENLHVSQPTVSIQIQKLSDAIGMPLFDCVGKKLYLTSVGEKVLEVAEDILDSLGQLSNDIIELKGEVQGDLKIASVTNSKYFMPRLLGVFLQKYPKVQPYLKVTNRARVLERMLHNEDDLYIIGQVPKEIDVHIEDFLENTLVFVAYPEHPLAYKKAISLNKICQERLLMRETGSGTRKVLDEVFKQHKLDANIYMDLGSSEAIKQAVMAGLGISVLSLNNLQLEIDSGHLVILDVKEFPVKRAWNIVYYKNKKLSLVARTFLEFMLSEGRDILR
ncbi:MAG: LysR family transcriptional regulator [Gammaproteobacteria bacterium]|nr:LysR family transcriptional regulator [Gammaproteobacteria bacterium]